MQILPANQTFTTLLLFIAVFLHNYSHGYKILGIFPYMGKSHFDVFAPLLRELAARGHDVTVLSYFPQKSPLPNYKDISLLDPNEQVLVEVVDVSIIKFMQKFNDLGAFGILSSQGNKECEKLGSTAVQNLIKSNQKFDVILQEHFNTDCFLALSHILKAPQVGVSSCTQMPWSYDRMGVPFLTSYVPNSILYYSDKMTFFERVHNTIATFVHNRILVELLMRGPNNQVVQKYLAKYNVPELEEIAKNTSVLLLNTHYSLNLPKPLPPSVIEVSGLHLSKERKPLPKDLEKFITESKHGVIYFSLGSMVRASTFPEEDRNQFLKAFAEIPQRVLWKYENETLPGKPDNVLIKKWMPQLDILDHPNVKAFISHGGLLGTIESVYSGVPIVTMPFFGDQFINSKALERIGVSSSLNINSLTKENIVKALQFVLDPSTQMKAKQLSKVYKDRPMSAMDTAIWWIEYVARNGGAPEMHSAIIDMPFYQASLLDVYAFLFIVLCLVIYLNVKILKFIKRKMFSKNKIKAE